MCKSTVIAKNVVTVMLVGLLASCTSLRGPVPNDPMFSPAYPEPITEPKRNNGAIYQSDRAVTLFEDRTARRVGDILTIRLIERTTAKKQANTKIKRKDTTNIDTPTILGQPLTFGKYAFNFSTNSSSDFDAKADSDQSNQLAGSISASVVKVLPNGYLVIRGEKWLELNQGNEYIRIVGIVRPDDINPDNEIASSRVANVRIAYSGTGELAESNARGWLARFFSGYKGIFPY